MFASKKLKSHLLLHPTIEIFKKSNFLNEEMLIAEITFQLKKEKKSIKRNL